jgi:Phosphorylase superfamily
MAREPIWLRPHAPVAERVLVPGDPGRALRLAVGLTGGVPRMLNHHRGLWGYTGTAVDGALLTVQSSGLGGPSVAAVVGDLALLGARRLVRIGTCIGVDPAIALGATIGAEAVASTDLVTDPVPAGTRARDLTTAGFLAAAARHGLEAAVLLVVVEAASGARLGDEALHAAELELGRQALALL